MENSEAVFGFPDLTHLKLLPLPSLDERSDKEIIHSIHLAPPVTSEQNVWAFWDSGVHNMPPWQKSNVANWVRLLGPDWTVRVLDLNRGSPANLFNFVDDEYLPKHLRDGKTTGQFAGSNTSDTVRLPLVYQHGGVWMDVGIILLMHLEQVCWTKLRDPKCKFEVAVASADPTLKSGVAENFFVAGRRANGFIKRWMLVLLEAWTGRINNKGIHAHPLFQHLVRDGNFSHVFQGADGDKLDYFQGYLAYDRIRLLEDPSDGFSGPLYCKHRVMLIEYKEFASAAMLTNDNGPRQAELFLTRYDMDQNSERYQDARKFFDYLLSSTAMIKLYHWRDHDIPTLADLWDKKEHLGDDCRPGTFGALLRHISSRFTQNRNISICKFPAIREKVLVAGVLETPDI
ncbi:hypothetical protein F5Y18DRAFT_418898 [Xylariaceae sp. FL1019]|nr:hypothetical protein F5Y18DRAFT_418898 [Xylariaceae sp. FL1019]